MDEIFNDSFFNNFMSTRSSTTPAVNIIEEEKEFRIDVAAPGLSKKDFKIDLNDDVLTISSEKQDEKDEQTDRYMRREFSYASFSRSFTLPETIEQNKIKAEHGEGILRIHLPKKEEVVKKGPKSIEIH
jgi:HSP20 family protein